MDTFEAIRNRHSYRGEFKDDPVSRADLELIIDAGIRAPSGCNAQTTSFVAVDDPHLAAAICELIDRPFTKTAKAFIVCIAEHRAAYGSVSFAVEDCAAAVENMLLAITSLGYASVWLDGVLRKDGIGEKIGAILDVPAGREVRVLLPVGVPGAVCLQRDRKPFEQRAFLNGWNKGQQKWS